MTGATKGACRVRGRGGFTLIELMMVTMIIGILASVSIPGFQSAVYKADASRLMGDAHTVALAAYEYLSEHGRFPSSAAAGTLPPEFVDHLSDGFPFTYKGVRYQWISITYPDRNNYWQTRNLGILMFDYSQRLELADHMYQYAGGDYFWGPDLFYLIYRG